MVIYSCLILIIFLISLIRAGWAFFFGTDLVLEWLLYRVNRFMIEFFFMLDWVSILFMRVVLIISSLIILYSLDYMEGDRNLNRFVVLMILFVISILIIILSPRLIRVLFGWDLLGLVSYCLVIYYQNYRAYNSGIVTVLTNRMGDVGLLLAVGVAVRYGRWNERALGKDWILVIMILLAGITKRAQMPFSSWLPMAMAAPTPVSSLVHSSTLVTAGVYLFIRYERFIRRSEVNYILMVASVGTIFISGLIAIFEFDLKKIIALSTLRQLGFIIIILSIGAKILGFYHLLTHAIFKSLLFMCAGCVIHIFKRRQDIRHYGNLGRSLPFLIVGFFVSILSLRGFPFMAGFYSKDFILEMIYIQQVNLVLIIFIVVSVSLTVIYSLRVCYYLFYGNRNYRSLGEIAENSVMNFSMVILIFLGVLVGSLFNWGFYFDFGGIFLSKYLKNVVVGAFFLGIFARMGLMEINLKFVKGRVLFFLSIWYINYLHVGFNKRVLNLSRYIYLVDQNWIERVERVIILKVKFIIINIYYSAFKMYDIIFNQILIFLVLFVFINIVLKGYSDSLT